MGTVRLSPALFAEVFRFGTLCCAIFALLVTVALGEAVVLWLAGYRYQAKSALHEACIGSLAVSANGRWAVSRTGFRQNFSKNGMECDVVWHDLRRFHATRLHVGHLAPETVAISPVTGTLAFGCLDGSVYLWRPTASSGVAIGAPIASPFLLGSLRQGPVLRLVFSPDDRYLAAADLKNLYVWRARTGELLHQRSHGGEECPVLGFCGRGHSLITSGDTSTQLCQWEVETGRSEKHLEFDSEVLAAAVSPTDRQIAVINTDNSLIAYDLATGKEQWRQHRKGSDGVCLAFTSDGSEVGAGGVPGQICFYDAKDGRPYAPLTQKAMIKGLTVAANGLLYSWDRCGEIRAWSIEHRQAVFGFSLLAWGRGERPNASPGPVFRGGALASVSEQNSKARVTAR